MIKYKQFFKRIDYKGKLEDISLLLCKDFQLGKFLSSKLITVGYEDFNFELETKQGKYFVKIFASFQNNDECRRYVDIMLKANKEGIAFPKLLKSKEGYFYTTTVKNTKLRLYITEYIDGKSYFLLKGKPNTKEIKYLAHQAALINSIDIKPDFIYNPWVIVNFPKEFQEKGKYLSRKDREAIEPLIKEFYDIRIQDIPHCFVHGDIIATNVMKDKNGKLWIIDFAASNYYPRIQELAVLACSLLFDETNREKTENNLKIALQIYAVLWPFSWQF